MYIDFIRAIGAFPGTAFVCLNETDETDVEFDRLNPRELKIELRETDGKGKSPLIVKANG